MRIAMFTNLYLPKVGGVAISVDRFSRAYRERGHEVLIVAPDFPGQPAKEDGVIRIHAIQDFNGTGFSLALPSGLEIARRLDDFEPELIHSHHPFLLGDSAVRAAAHRGLPLVYTHHTMYEYYTHYVPLDSRTMRNYVVQLATRYAELCDLIFAPSESVAALLRRRGVVTAMEVVPTGVMLEEFTCGDRARGRRLTGLDAGDFVIGHVGRIAAEKNLLFLARSIISALRRIDNSRFLLVGDGELADDLRGMFDEAGLGRRVIFAGERRGRELADLYAAMDVFAFTSKSETQGMVLAEALSAGTPLIALDAPGARDILADGRNGRLVKVEREDAFADALAQMARLPADEVGAMRRRARADAEFYSLDHCVDKALVAYRRLLDTKGPTRRLDTLNWDTMLESIRREWEIWSNRAASLTEALA
ncbi:MAG: glycosyltransferase, partial [Planctomycetota bacterium]